MAPPSGRRRDDDDAPWLAEVESDGRASTLVSRGRFIGGLIVFALLFVLIVIGIYFITQTKEDGASGTPVARAEDAPLITADPGPYKVLPADVGGMAVDGTGGSIYDAGRGGDTPGQLSTAGLPEEPGPRPGGEPVSLLPPGDELPAIPPVVSQPAVLKPVPQPGVAAAGAAPALVVRPPVAPAVVAPRAKPGASATVLLTKPQTAPPHAAPVAPVVAAGTGTTLQLGAFSSVGKAEAAWKSLSGRFGYLAVLSKRIEPVERETGTLYRLRATGSADHAAAVQSCAMLKVAGENCMVTQ